MVSDPEYEHYIATHKGVLDQVMRCMRAYDKPSLRGEVSRLTVSLRRLEPLSSFSADEAPLAFRLLSIVIIMDMVA